MLKKWLWGKTKTNIVTNLQRKIENRGTRIIEKGVVENSWRDESKIQASARGSWNSKV